MPPKAKKVPIKPKPKPKAKPKAKATPKPKTPVTSETKHEGHNIIQNVIVKQEEPEKPKRKARKPRKKVATQAKESIMINANIPPAIIYQQAPSTYIPPAQTLPPVPPVPPKPPTPPTPPPPIVAPNIPPQFNKKAVAQFTQTESLPILEDIESYVSTPIERLSKGERTEGFITPVNEPILGVGSYEFPPTATYPSESEKIKATETPDKVYNMEPPSFKSEVAGASTFGEELIPSKTTKKISIDYDEDNPQKEIKPRASRLPLETKVGGEIYSADMSKPKLTDAYIKIFGKKPPSSWRKTEIVDALGHPEGKLVERISLPPTRPKANIVMSPPVKLNITDETIPIEIKSK